MTNAQRGSFYYLSIDSTRMMTDDVVKFLTPPSSSPTQSINRPTHTEGVKKHKGKGLNIEHISSTRPYIDEYNMGLGPKKPIRVCLFFPPPFPFIF